MKRNDQNKEIHTAQQKKNNGEKVSAVTVTLGSKGRKSLKGDWMGKKKKWFQWILRTDD